MDGGSKRKKEIKTEKKPTYTKTSLSNLQKNETVSFCAAKNQFKVPRSPKAVSQLYNDRHDHEIEIFSDGEMVDIESDADVSFSFEEREGGEKGNVDEMWCPLKELDSGSEIPSVSTYM